MNNKIKIFNTIKPFNKTLRVEGDKSLSIRWALLASQANGKSRSQFPRVIAVAMCHAEQLLRHMLSALSMHAMRRVWPMII